MVRIILTDEQKAEIVKLYKEGVTPTEIGLKFDILDNSVTRILRNMNIERNQAAAKVRNDPEKVKYIVSEYLRLVSSEVIAKELGVNGSTVIKILRSNNITIRPTPRNKRIAPLEKETE